MQFKNLLAILALATAAVTATPFDGRDYHNHQKPVEVIEFECIEFIAICPANAQPFCCINGYGDKNCVPWCKFVPDALCFVGFRDSIRSSDTTADTSLSHRRYLR